MRIFFLQHSQTEAHTPVIMSAFWMKSAFMKKNPPTRGGIRAKDTKKKFRDD